ncbi:hypothetical protein VB796_08770 [Arcicella sp. LKC2W]|uniref:hypothetical protein n=1 Tax=Arcicella sp. LKC2W TaxID=2984198 RepID=UPI002B1ECFB7|nr:hypothetical protein [Arcicella sp. LKC2W]MEA5459127.1 hypothetical protein [Arcicella sp. LKC2W]
MKKIASIVLLFLSFITQAQNLLSTTDLSNGLYRYRYMTASKRCPSCPAVKVGFDLTIDTLESYMNKRIKIPVNSVLNLSTFFSNTDNKIQRIDKELSPLLISNAVDISNCTNYWAFGDSFTAYGTNPYSFILANKYGLSLTNKSYPGKGIFKVSSSINSDFVIGTKKTLISTLIGFNDLRRGGNNVKTFNKIKYGLQTVFANQFLASAIPANSSLITKSGTWSENSFSGIGGKASFIGGNGIFTSTVNDFITYSFTGDNVVVGTIVTDGVTQASGNFDILIDNVLYQNFNCNGLTDGISDGDYDNTRNPTTIFITGLTSGSHTLKIVQKSSSNIYIDYIGQLKAPQLCSPVIVGLVPRMNPTGYATSPSASNDAVVDIANQYILESIGNLSGYPISFANVDRFYDISKDVDTDNIHPNSRGQIDIANAFAKNINCTKPDKFFSTGELTGTIANSSSSILTLVPKVTQGSGTLSSTVFTSTKNSKYRISFGVSLSGTTTSSGRIILQISGTNGNFLTNPKNLLVQNVPNNSEQFQGGTVSCDVILNVGETISLSIYQTYATSSVSVSQANSFYTISEL